MTNRLKTEIRVQAWLRQFSSAGLMATVIRKGDADAGALFLMVNRFSGGCDVYSGVTTPSGQPGWMHATGPDSVTEKDADAYLSRQARYDPDLWILEVEDPKGVFAMDEPVVKM